jgi:hypothetical protein
MLIKKRLSWCNCLIVAGAIGFAAVAQARALVATTTTLTIAPNPITVGQTRTLTVTVTAADGKTPLTGPVAISVNGVANVLYQLTNGVYTSTAAQGGDPRTDVFIAGYLGDSQTSPSQSAAVSLVTVAAKPPVALTSSANPAFAGQAINFAATVTGNSGVPTGTVSYNFGDNSAPSVQTLNNAGVATATHAYSSAGSYAVTATYSGDGHNPSSAGTIGQAIGLAGTSPGLDFVPVPPCRIADTRNAAGPFGGPSLGAQTRSFVVPQSACGIPADAAAYALNVTAVPAGPLNWLTVWPTGQATPGVSLLNSPDGRVKSNAAIVQAGTSGAISVSANTASSTDVLLDITGYFTTSNAVPVLGFYPLTPCRVVDTRNATGPLGGPYLTGGQVRNFPVKTSNCNIPDYAQAYSLNVTVIPAGALNYLTVWPTGQVQPYVSTLNAPTGTTTANAAIVEGGTNGNISVYPTSDADFIVDVNGYFAPYSVGSLYYYAVPPCRVLDTRSDVYPPFPGTYTVGVQTSPCGVSAAASAYVMNATVVPDGSLNHLTLWPSGAAQPNVSTLNAFDGDVTSNMAIVPTTNGAIDAFGAEPNPSQLILDISGYFAQ